MIVGLGVVLVCDLRVVSDAPFTLLAAPLLLLVPCTLLYLTITQRADLRICAMPYGVESSRS